MKQGRWIIYGRQGTNRNLRFFLLGLNASDWENASSVHCSHQYSHHYLAQDFIISQLRRCNQSSLETRWASSGGCKLTKANFSHLVFKSNNNNQHRQKHKQWLVLYRTFLFSPGSSPTFARTSLYGDFAISTL